MFAEAPAPWKLPSLVKGTKQDPGAPQRRRSGKDRRQVSSQRIRFLGLEIKPELVWDDWDLQGEFTKTLKLKNSHDKLQKLRVRPPVSKFFTTSIPEIIFLSPGMSFSWAVTFKPLQMCDYEDNIEFLGKDGSFQVFLRATIPCPALEVPDSVLLPFCAVQHSSHTTFLLKNVGKLQTYFQWECAAPFQLSPEQGLLKPGQECHITVVFQPQEALVHQQQAYCRFGEKKDDTESSCTVLLQGLAKYPCLLLRTLDTKDEKEQCGSVLSFGSVAVGQSLQKHFEIFNPSPVSASFSLSRLSDYVPLLESEFSFDVTKGKVASGGLQRATVTYTPTVVDAVSVEYLSLKCRGALNEPLLKLTGNCLGPKVSLSSSVVDFGCVEQGGTVVQTLELVNDSPVEAVYQWDLDCNGHSVFSIQPAGGTLHPHSQMTLKALYRPTQPIAHHRRVACLILHRDPMMLDLMGKSHSELQKPAILKPEHLVLYKFKWYCRQDPPDTLSILQQDNEDKLKQQNMLGPPEERRASAGVASRTPIEEYYQSCLGWKDPSFSTSSLSSPHVSVVPCELLFNHKTSSSLTTSCTSAQSVSITNHTKGKLSLVWTVAQGSPFSVSPSSCDLAPLKCTSFRVKYDPKQLNTLHEAQLECFAYYKDSVEEGLLCPPWCVTVRIVGHSFLPGKEHFIPCCSLKPPRVLFPGLSVISYQTVLLQNCGNLPLTFCLDRTSNPTLTESVSVMPSCGLVQPGNHQILTLRATPTEESPKEGFSIHLQLNAAKHTKELKVVSAIEKLCVSLEGHDRLYFQPTAVGSQTRRSHRIKNLSRLPLRFQWSIPESDQELISVEPDAGELQPNESSVQMWSFNPQAERTYTLKATLKFWPTQTPGCNESDLSLIVVGVGSRGFIEAEKAVLDIGEILVGSYRSIEVPLVNRSSCPVSFHLSVQQRLLDEDLVAGPETLPIDFQLDCERGTIASHSTMMLRSAIRPHRPAKYQWIISYQTVNASECVSSPPQELCEVRAEGVFPTLQVIDVCSGGHVDSLSKVHLWKLFSLDSLNEHLLLNPSPTELTYRTPTRHSLAASPSIFTKTMMDFNFSAAPLNSDPSTFVLIFHNPGTIPVDWAFLFPEDQQIELEYWAETGEFTNTELYQMKVQDNHLFSISPRSGALLPGQQNAVHFSYSHNFVGTDRFPVVFKLSYGREILLNFHGVTMESDRPYLHFPSKQHNFTSVAIGDSAPPMQVFELYNGGAVSVQYNVDTAVVSQVQSDNFNHPVLRCLNPNGEVLPGKTIMLNWIFSPLEAKMYHMDIPIHVQGGDSTLVRFSGCGFNPHSLGSTNFFSCSDVKRNVQMLPLPGQVVMLSEDSVSLGHIPVCSRSSRILFLSNVSHTDTVHFAWEWLQQVQINPKQGRLHPGERILCALNFTSTDYPTCYQLDVKCQIVKEVALTREHSALQRWDEEEKQQDNCTVIDNSIKNSQGVLIDKKPIVALFRKGPPLRKYKTLPPIVTRSKVCGRPEPRLGLLHLGVTAHSHGIQEYITHFPDQFKERYRCFQFVKPQQTENTSSSTPPPTQLPPPTHGPDREISIHILNSLLREIHYDEAFIPSLVTFTSKPNILPRRPCPSPSDPTPQNEQHNTVDQRGIAGCSSNRPQTQNMLYTEHAQVEVVADVFLNTLQSLVAEAVREEFVPTAPPRSVILPTVSTTLENAMHR